MPSLLMSISSASTRRVYQALTGRLGPAWDRAHTRSCLGETHSPARSPTRKIIKLFSAESGFCGKDTGFGRNVVSGSCAPDHVTRRRQPKPCHWAGRESCILLRAVLLSNISGDLKAPTEHNGLGDRGSLARPVGSLRAPSGGGSGLSAHSAASGE